MAGKNSNPEDRRLLRRYPAAELRASLRVKKGLFNESWVEIQPLDYNKQGLAFDTTAELKPEEDVMVALELVMDMGSIQIEKLAGVVRYARSAGSQFRYGIEFDFQGPRFMRSPDIETQLARIETLLQRSLNVQHRIRSQKGIALD